MELTSHPFEWYWGGRRWEGRFSEHLYYEYVWISLRWPMRLMVKRMRNAYIKLPPDLQEAVPPDGLARDGFYVPPACLFQMEPTCEEEAFVSGTIYLEAR